jgi:hypothetical protein
MSEEENTRNDDLPPSIYDRLPEDHPLKKQLDERVGFEPGLSDEEMADLDAFWDEVHRAVAAGEDPWADGDDDDDEDWFVADELPDTPEQFGRPVD